jgi:hypothetical protein
MKGCNNYRNIMGTFALIELKKTNIMGNLLYVIAVILIIGWAIGFFGYAAGGMIHILLVIGLIVLVVKLVQGRRII